MIMCFATSAWGARPAFEDVEGDGIAQHLSDRTIVEVGRTRVIAFTISKAMAEDRALKCRLSNSELVTILYPPQVMANQTIGYVRVKGLKLGTTRLVIGGQYVRADASHPSPNRHRHRSPLVRCQALHSQSASGQLLGCCRCLER